MERIIITALVLLLLIGASVGNDSSRISGDDERCGPYKYFDEQRLVCLDLCGSNNETRCMIERFCSTTVSWGNSINPPSCLPHCIRGCDSPMYCDHKESDCRPCDSLCSRPDMTQCRKYCYDVYVLLTTASPNNTTSQDITTSQTITTDRDHATLAVPYEPVLSQNHSWKTIGVVQSCVSVILLFLLFISIIRYCQKSTEGAGGEADGSLLRGEKQWEPDTPNMDKMNVNPA